MPFGLSRQPLWACIKCGVYAATEPRGTGLACRNKEPSPLAPAEVKY